MSDSSMLERTYSASFFGDISSTSRTSAQALMPRVVERFSPISLIDVGAGTGIWAATARDLGVASVTCVDGPHVKELRSDADSLEFMFHDLSEPLPVDLLGTYDVSICLEVAEHLDAERADGFVDELCSLAPVTVFSSAIPGQGGVGHVNEQWQSYWVELFGRRDRHVDLSLRDATWNDTRIAWWYRQNVLVFLPGSSDRTAPRGDGGAMVDVVHPGCFASALDREPRTRRLVSLLLRRGARKLRGVG